MDLEQVKAKVPDFSTRCLACYLNHFDQLTDVSASFITLPISSCTGYGPMKTG